MCVYMYICIYVYMYICIYICIYVYIMYWFIGFVLCVNFLFKNKINIRHWCKPAYLPPMLATYLIRRGGTRDTIGFSNLDSHVIQRSHSIYNPWTLTVCLVFFVCVWGFIYFDTLPRRCLWSRIKWRAHGPQDHFRSSCACDPAQWSAHGSGGTVPQ